MVKKKQETEKTFGEIQAENQQLYKQLTNKNEDYVFQLSNRLDELDYESTQKEYVLNKMLHEIIIAQENSVPARRIYGTVTEQAYKITGGTSALVAGVPNEKSPTWMLYMDGALLLGGLFAVINGVMAIRGGLDNQVGLLQVILNFVLGGFAMLVLVNYAPAPGETKGLFRYLVATLVVMFGWLLVMYGILFILPVALNPWVPGEFIIGLGVVALVAKWYFKKKLNIRGTLF